MSVEDAKAIALNHAGLSSDDVVFVISKFDNDIALQNVGIIVGSVPGDDSTFTVYFPTN